MCIRPMLQLVINGSDAQLALQRTEHTLDLCQLHVARPQHGWIFTSKIAAQQIMPVTLLSGLQFGFVYLK